MEQDLVFGKGNQRKLTVSGAFDTAGDLEITAEAPDYGGWSGPRIQDVYFYLNREEMTRLRDHINKLLEK